MSFDSRAVANHFLRVAKEDGKHLENMKLQKLMFYAHGYWLAEEGRPLLDEAIQAWKWGPVVETIYHEFKRFGNGPIRTRAVNDEGIVARIPQIPDGDRARRLIERVYKAFRNESGVELAKQTHEPGTPWSATVEPYGAKVPRFLSIPDEIIREYFAERPLPNAYVG